MKAYPQTYTREIQAFSSMPLRFGLVYCTNYCGYNYYIKYLRKYDSNDFFKVTNYALLMSLGRMPG